MKLKLIDIYVNLTKEVSIANIGPPYSYYHADQSNADIIVQNVQNIDIKSAFPTICKLIFGKDHPFVIEIFNKKEKLERNILISTTLKNYSQKTGINYLNEIVLLSKILVFCYVYTFYNKIEILEYVKDGMYIIGEKNTIFNDNQLKFIDIMKEYDINFHDDFLKYYLRFNKTSIYKKDDNIIIKGKYRNVPECINDCIKKFFNGILYNQKLLSLIQYYYSDILCKIVINTPLKEYIDYLYSFKEEENRKYLNETGFIDNIKNINSKTYLYEIIYPILNLLRSQSTF